MLIEAKTKADSIDDANIPVMRHVFNKATMQHGLSNPKRLYHFIKGPIPYSWMQKAAYLPGKSLATGLSLWYLKGLKGTNTFSVNAKAVSLAGCSRQAYARGLQSLEQAGLIEVDQQPGRRPVVTIKAFEIDNLDA